MLAEDLLVIDGDSPLWPIARPLLHAALQLEQRDQSFSWHGWQKQPISDFLQGLPQRCAIIAGVWETVPGEDPLSDTELLRLGLVCEVIDGQICTIRTFQALLPAGLKPLRELEPGINDALEIMRIVRAEIAPVAWALFTDTTTWNAWMFGSAAQVDDADKATLLAELARKGCCVLLGSRAAHHHPERL